MKFLIEPISRQAYAPYGDLIAADEAMPFNYANMKTAKRFNFLSEVVNLRPERAKLNLCVFRCSPLEKLPFEIKLLERHEFSTQVFMPMSSDARFVVIVSLGGDKPDLASLKAFEVTNPQGISYRPGVWHYPMTVLDNQVDFSCLVHEDGGSNDCEVVQFDHPCEIAVAE
jgi:ureidoglycolate lyase